MNPLATKKFWVFVGVPALTALLVGEPWWPLWAMVAAFHLGWVFGWSAATNEAHRLDATYDCYCGHELFAGELCGYCNARLLLGLKG